MADAGLSDHPVNIEFEQLVLPEQVQKQIAFMNRIYGIYGEEVLIASIGIYFVWLWRNIGSVLDRYWRHKLFVFISNEYVLSARMNK